jgi:hypothetical protein
MARSISMYQQYWELLKKHRGKWLELQVPEEYQERVFKAIKKRKWIEHSTTANFYPDLVVIRKPEVNLLLLMLPVNKIDTI